MSYFIQNEGLYRLKHIGLVMCAIGVLLMILQFMRHDYFPYSTIALIVSIIFQLLGWKEPLWFLRRIKEDD